MGIGGGVLFSGIWLGTRSFLEHPSLHVENVVFDGHIVATDAELRHLSDIRSGKHVMRIDLQRAVDGVTRHPWVKDASAQIQLPSGVNISVQEHRPFMMVALEELWYVDSSGEIFARARTEDLDYPILSGLDTDLVEHRPQVANAIVGRTLRLLQATHINALNGPQSISEVHFDNGRGFSVVLRTGTELTLGFADPTDRLSRLDQMVEQGLDLSTPQRIDLEAETVAIAAPLNNQY